MLYTQKSVSYKSVLEVQVSKCSELLLSSTCNALQTDKLIQTQQEKSAAFSYTQAAPPGCNRSISPNGGIQTTVRPFPQRSTNHCIYKLIKHK